MPTWDVSLVSTTYCTLRIQADSEEEALEKARNTPLEERGPTTTDWDIEASLVDEAEEEIDEL